MINALRFVEELENAGFTPEQAKKSVDTWMSLMNDNFATKSDLRELQLAVRADFREFQYAINSDFREFQYVINSDFREFQFLNKAELREVESRLGCEIGKVEKLIDKQTIKFGGMMVTLITLSTAILSITLS